MTAPPARGCWISRATSNAPPAAPIDFRKLFDAESAYVWKTLRRLGVAPSDIEDVASNVWLVVHRRLDSYDGTKPLRPWLFGIAFRVAFSRIASSFSPGDCHSRNVITSWKMQPSS